MPRQIKDLIYILVVVAVSAVAALAIGWPLSGCSTCPESGEDGGADGGEDGGGEGDAGIDLCPDGTYQASEHTCWRNDILAGTYYQAEQACVNLPDFTIDSDGAVRGWWLAGVDDYRFLLGGCGDWDPQHSTSGQCSPCSESEDCSALSWPGEPMWTVGEPAGIIDDRWVVDPVSGEFSAAPTGEVRKFRCVADL